MIAEHNSKNKKIILVIAIIALIGVITGLWWLTGNNRKINGASEKSTVEKSEISGLIEGFGQALKNVSLLGPTVTRDIAINYQDFLTPELLAKWENDPSLAVGRTTSSPWPDRIEISSIEPSGTDAYGVNGYIVEVTSADFTSDNGLVCSSGASCAGGARQSISLSVVKSGDRWLIAEVAVGPKEQANAGNITGESATGTAPIQGQSAGPGWKTVSSSTAGVAFAYPENLDAKYIHTQNWPPEISVSAPGHPMTCPVTAPESSLPSRILRPTINGRVYCVRALSEGAAGTVYTDYSYSTVIDGRIVTLDFTLGFPQCGNYDDPQKSECENERETFDLDSLVDGIMDTVAFTGPAGAMETSVSWDEAVQAIADCEVEQVFQAHSLAVNLELKDGRELITAEPRIDDVIDAVNAAEPECGRIPIGTE